jgi:uncharacterized protein YndB with AHSA1/START domain
MKLIDINLSRTIPARAEEIYDAWLDPRTPGGPWFGAKHAIVNPTLDGLFYHAVEHEGKEWAHYGRFLALERARRIEHTWVSEATRGVESIVTLTLEPQGDATRLSLRHANVPDDELGRQHEMGWSWMLDMLAEAKAARRA